jgi:hypothetical protein
MVECVTFADDIKYKGGSYQSSWHFIDQPYLDDGGTEADYPEFIPDTHNVTEAISAITNWINKENDYMSTYEYQQIMANGVKGHTEADGLSTAMRLLLHYAGDVHQPLHGTARVDDEFPAGDRGGNSFPLQPVDGAKNLHAAWDSVLYSEAGDYPLVSTFYLLTLFYSHSPTLTGTVSPPRLRSSSLSIQSLTQLPTTSIQCIGPTTPLKFLSPSFTKTSPRMQLSQMTTLPRAKSLPRNRSSRVDTDLLLLLSPSILTTGPLNQR